VKTDRYKAKYLNFYSTCLKKCAETYYFQQIVNINHVKYLNDGKSANIKIKKNEKNENI